jgi:hypothetical protein
LALRVPPVQGQRQEPGPADLSCAGCYCDYYLSRCILNRGHDDAGQVQGFGGAFVFLMGQPFGRVVLGIVALGFVALGLHSFACARWIRLMGRFA